jgi:hypothetical protein
VDSLSDPGKPDAATTDGPLEAEAFASPPLSLVEGVAFGDLFLEDVRAYREERLTGEFHTFVHGGPIFASPIACATGAVVEREGFLFCDMR